MWRLPAGTGAGWRRWRSPSRAASRWMLAVAVIGAAVAAVLMLARGSPGASPETVSLSPRAWSLPRLTGPGQLTLSSFRGRPLVLDFFASWCDSCETELPQFASVAQGLGGRIGFAGVDSEETADGVAMANRTGIGGWPLARDVGGRQRSGLRDALEPTPGMPITAFYDAQGRLLHVQLGAMSREALTAEITTLYHLPVA